MVKPILEPEFKPAIIELREFNQLVNKYENKKHLIVAIERAGGFIYRKEFDILPDGVDDERNLFIAERIIKCMLWAVGGYKIYIAGSHLIFNKIKSYYTEGGLRDFDYHFMGTVFEKEMKVVECSNDDIPQMKASSLSIGGHLEGRRIGFDVGGSDIKVSAVKDGGVLSSEEIVWLPKLNEDINYHYDYFYNAMKKAIDKLGGDVDAIGISAAGVIVNNKPMVDVRRLITYDSVWYPSHKEAHAISSAKSISKSIQTVTESVADVKDVINSVMIPLKEILEAVGKTDINTQMIMESFDLPLESITGLTPDKRFAIIKDENNTIYAGISPETKIRVDDFFNSFKV